MKTATTFKAGDRVIIHQRWKASRKRRARRAPSPFRGTGIVLAFNDPLAHVDGLLGIHLKRRPTQAEVDQMLIDMGLALANAGPQHPVLIDPGIPVPAGFRSRVIWFRPDDLTHTK